ncbi:MAG: TonB-dependent receptor domain-containing protein [Candidatus Cryptobacteroides sp.]
MKKILASVILIIITLSASAQMRTFSGVVLDKNTDLPVEFATILLKGTEQWAVADENGKFTIRNIQAGKNTLEISCLGYVTKTFDIVISKDIANFKVMLDADNLTLESVVVTSQENENSATTSRIIDRTALDHVQMVNVADVASLLPGGATTNPLLTTEQRFSIRSGGTSETGNATFGTAVEVDGVRLSSNASFSNFATGSGLKGSTTNNISSANIESVEIISGVASVEYGDMSSGVVKVNTKKGITPYTITFTTNPNTKQASVSKGFSLGKNRKGNSNGILNASAEYTYAVTDQRSPYSSYKRQSLSLTYSNIFDNGLLADMPLKFSAGLTGNLGGRNTEADPDSYKGTYTKDRDNVIRGNFSFDWLLSKPWITNLELKGSLSYSNNQNVTNSNYSSAAGTVALHGKEEGYFVAQLYETDPDAAITLIPRGNWYNTMCIDDRPLNYKLSLKANWARNFGSVNNKVKLGVEWTGDGNFGIGEYSEDMSNAPTFREYRYCDVPFMNNLAAYLEDNVVIPMGKTRLNLIAGLRLDNTFIKDSEYGGISSLSPRINAKYTVLSPRNRRQNVVKELSFRASWGISVKQPAYSILYPTPSYRDIPTFTPTASSDGSAYYAYYIMPRTIVYNPQLVWQKNHQSEIGMEMDIDGFRISLSAYYNRTLDSYRLSTGYERFTYNYTNAEHLETSCSIGADDRLFEVDRNTGIVTVHDKTGAQPSQTLPYTPKNSFSSYTYADNSTSPISRYGVEWIIDFKKIKAINTTIRLDGSFYGYKALDTQTLSYCPYTLNSYDGSPYKYVGFYTGGHVISNGKETRNLNTNLTITTHFPKIRMIFSVKVEAGLLNYSRTLSEYADGQARSFVISDKNDILSITDENIYDGDNFTVSFPDTYISFDDPDNPRDYLSDLKWARENDKELYNDLSKLAVSSGYVYYFAKNYISPYFSANISVTKEIGDLASISFYANNFFNNRGQVYSTRTGNWMSVSGYIPSFFYGLTLRLIF